MKLPAAIFVQKNTWYDANCSRGEKFDHPYQQFGTLRALFVSGAAFRFGTAGGLLSYEIRKI